MLAAGLLAVACGLQGKGPPALGVERVWPQAQSGDLARLYLNQPITVYFTGDLDPMSVTPDTVRVLDDNGHAVRGRLEVGSTSVTFRPDPPLAPTLDDGSFVPDRRYRLVVSGYPKLDSVRSRGGRGLRQTWVQEFRAVPATGLGGLPTPFLPVGTGRESFIVRDDGQLPRSIPADSGKLQIHFSLPVLPTSLSPDAFFVSIIRHGGVDRPPFPRLQPASVRLVTQPQPLSDHPGATVEIELGREVQLLEGGAAHRLEPGDMILVQLEMGPAGLRDYRDRGVQLPRNGQLPAWVVVAGDRVALAEWPGPESDYRDDDAPVPGLVVSRDGNGTAIRPQVFREAGTGALGLFRPRRSLVLEPGVPFDRGDGTEVVVQGDAFEFLGVDIPSGVTVTLRSGRSGRVQLFSCGSIHVRGVLQLETEPAAIGFRGGDNATFRAVIERAGAVLVAAGNILIAGRITHAEAPDPSRSPLTLLAGGRIEGRGTIPPFSVLAVQSGQLNLPLTAAEKPVRVSLTWLTPGVAPGAAYEVVGWTPWVAAPVAELVRVRLEAADGVAVAVQTAAPDPVRSDAPDRRPEHALRPFPVRDGDPLQLPQPGFVRFQLRAQLRDGIRLPSLGGIRLVGGE